MVSSTINEVQVYSLVGNSSQFISSVLFRSLPKVQKLSFLIVQDTNFSNSFSKMPGLRVLRVQRVKFDYGSIISAAGTLEELVLGRDSYYQFGSEKKRIITITAGDAVRFKRLRRFGVYRSSMINNDPEVLRIILNTQNFSCFRSVSLDYSNEWDKFLSEHPQCSNSVSMGLVWFKKIIWA